MKKHSLALLAALAIATCAFAQPSIPVTNLNPVTTASIVGRNTAGTGRGEVLTATNVRSILGLTTAGAAPTADVVLFLTAANYAAMRTQLALVIGTNVQAYDADLTTWAGITPGANVGTALTVAVGSAGAFVVNGGALGTPSSGTATNLTGTAAGLTAGTASAVAVGGITGLGTNVATALAVNVGSAGAFVTFDGAGGTPSSLTLTNATGLPVAGGGTGVATLTAYAPVFGGTTGTGAVQSGTAGTQGQVMVSNGAGVLPAFEALDLGDADAVTGVLPVANGGTGSSSALVEKLATFSVDGGGAAIATGTISGTARLPYACTLTGYSISATAATGTTTVKFWVKATGTAIPTIADVVNTSGVSLTTGTSVASATLSDFTDTAYAAGDMVRCAITAVDSAATDLTVTLYGTRQ